MSEINSAFGLLQLQHIDGAIAERKIIDATYRTALRDVSGVRCLESTGEKVANFSYFPILIEDEYPLSRDALYQQLKNHDVHARRYFYPLISDFSMYMKSPSASRDNLLNASMVAEKVICLPIYPSLKSNEIEFILRIISGNSK